MPDRGGPALSGDRVEITVLAVCVAAGGILGRGLTGMPALGTAVGAAAGVAVTRATADHRSRPWPA